MKNPLLRSFNEEISFSNLKSEQISEANVSAIESAKLQLKTIVNSVELTFETTLSEWDRLQNTISRIFSPIYLMAEVHPNEKIRSESRKSIEQFSEFLNELAINEDFYKTIKKFTDTDEAKSLSGPKKKFLDDTLLNFKRSGFDLPASDRERLKNVKIDIDVLCLEFSKNIGEATGFLEISESETDGLPQDYLDERKTTEGTFKIDLSYPSYHPFMKYSEDSELRQKLMMMFYNRAYPANISVLDKILEKRAELASILGYKTYADFATEDRMVKSPSTVWKFETELIQSVKAKAEKDYSELLDIKSHTIGKSADKIDEWDLAFYTNKLKETKYSVDDQEIKQYFELNNTINGLFSITQKILALKYVEEKNPSVWFDDVRKFKVYDNSTNKMIGSFYLDLHPRENKYSHAAMFPMVNGMNLNDGKYEFPMATLVCNFPKPTKTQSSLLTFSDVKTLFHEFGHLLHGMVTNSPFSVYAGTNTVIDFVETPSQFFENFVYDYEVLSLFAKHYKTNQVIPFNLFEKLVSAKFLGSGIQTQQQIFYGTYDFTLHNNSQSAGQNHTTEILKKIKSETTKFSYTEGDHFQASFGHLAGYGAGYYSYLWSKVYAQDIWSVFEKEGILNETVGLKFRKSVLEPGGSKDALELVENFLGREPNNTAFLKELGI